MSASPTTSSPRPCALCGSVADTEARRRLCGRCRLRQLSADVLDDGHGRVDVRLLAVHEALCAMAKPRTGIAWLTTPAVRERFRPLVSGEVALTHEGVDTLAAGLGREYLRELLVAHQVLAQRDKYLAAFERWTATRLEAVPAGEDRQLIQTYLAWHHHRRLRERAELGLLHESTTQSARQQTNVAVGFLAWLHERGRSLAECAQADIDDWFATGTTTRWALRNFLTWAIAQRRCPALDVPSYRGRSAPVLSQQARLAILNRLFTDTTVELSDRVAGCLVLIYAQPASRIRLLTVDDLERRAEETWIRLAREHVPLPECVKPRWPHRAHLNWPHPLPRADGTGGGRAGWTGGRTRRPR